MLQKKVEAFRSVQGNHWHSDSKMTWVPMQMTVSLLLLHTALFFFVSFHGCLENYSFSNSWNHLFNFKILNNILLQVLRAVNFFCPVIKTIMLHSHPMGRNYSYCGSIKSLEKAISVLFNMKIFVNTLLKCLS